MFIDCGYNKETELLNYKFKMGEGVAVSTFKVSKEKVKLMSPELIAGERVDDEEIYKKLFETFMDERYKVYNGVYVDKEANENHLEVLNEALQYDKKVFIEYESGWESYPHSEEDGAICSDDGLTHVYRVGKSTGEKPIFLAIEIGEHGGGEFLFKGIKILKLID